MTRDDFGSHTEADAGRYDRATSDYDPTDEAPDDLLTERRWKALGGQRGAAARKAAQPVIAVPDDPWSTR